MSGSGSMASLASGGSAERQGGNQVRIMHNAPPPEQWTLVREVNMERREPCEIWRSGVNHQLFKMKEQWSSCGSTIRKLETDLVQDRQSILTSRQSPSERNSELTATGHSSVSVQTEDGH